MKFDDEQGDWDLAVVRRTLSVGLLQDGSARARPLVDLASFSAGSLLGSGHCTV